MKNTNKTYKPAILVAVASLLWSLDGVFRSPVSGLMDGSLIVFSEFFLATLLYFPVAFYFHKKDLFIIKKNHWILLLLLGAFGSTLAGIFFTKSITYVGSSMATLLEMAQPLVVLFLAKLLLKEKHSSFFYPIAFWAIANAILLSIPDFQFGNSNLDPANLEIGILFALVAVIMWGLATVLGKFLLNFYSPIIVSFWRGFFASIIAGIFMLYNNSFDIQLIMINFGDLLGLATIAGAIPLAIYYFGLKHLKASLVTFIELLYALFGVIIPIVQGSMSLKTMHVFASVSLLLMISLLIYFETDLKKSKN